MDSSLGEPALPPSFVKGLRLVIFMAYSTTRIHHCNRRAKVAAARKALMLNEILPSDSMPRAAGRVRGHCPDTPPDIKEGASL
jgi:hypothetical protein